VRKPDKALADIPALSSKKNLSAKSMNNTRKLSEADVPNVVAVHVSAFSGFFLTTLGTAFLRKYYRAVISHKDSICIGCEDEMGKFIGFAVGNRLSKGFHLKILRRHWLVFMLEGLRLAMMRPKAIIRLYKNLSKNSHASDNGLYAELLSIGVCVSAEGKGVGRQLIEQFEYLAIKSGAAKICLTTDKNENERGLGFYLKNGYHIFYEFTTYPNRSMYKLIKNFV
jgi:ribosomal protein S18 acetylase RimI-like enzyme